MGLWFFLRLIWSCRMGLGWRNEGKAGDVKNDESSVVLFEIGFLLVLLYFEGLSS